MLTRRRFLLGAAALSGSVSRSEVWANADARDLLLTGGKIYTGLVQRPTVEALVIRGGRIAHAGSLAVARSAAHRASVIDLDGGTAFPGFVDAHAHLTAIGLRELTLNLEGVRSLAALTSKLRDWATNTQPSGPISGRGWIETHWPEARFPTRADLDAIVADRPVWLERADGHAGVANTAALALAGVTPSTANPAGGEILRDASGAATGMLIDNAQSLVVERLPKPDAAMLREALVRANKLYLSRGWTGIHNMSVSAEDVALMSELAAAGALRLRLDNYLDSGSAALTLERGPAADSSGRVRIRGIKLYADGALGSRGAALLAPYSDLPNSRGLTLLEVPEALDWMRKAEARGLQLAIHAIGDRGNRMVLDAYESYSQGRPLPGRWRIEHAQVLALEDVPRFAKLGIIASMQPSHAIGDLYFAPARLGSERLHGAYAWRRLLDSGAVICAGSDAPVEKGDPLIEFYAAVHRHALDGFANRDWNLDQRVSRLEALQMLTSAPAFAAHREFELGALQVGRRADISVFSRDLLNAEPREILRSKCTLTMIEGRVEFSA
jgi:predicted amidohydrolase YtcJ